MWKQMIAILEVERSFDQNNFSTAAFILGAQSSNNDLSQYSFTDEAKGIMNHNIIYYRLKQVDINGSFSYSSIKWFVLVIWISPLSLFSKFYLIPIWIK